MTFQVLLHPAVRKTLSSLLEDDRQRIKTALGRLADDPVTTRSGVAIKRLTGTRGRGDLFRSRIGTYRAVYAVDGNDVLVTDLVRRGRDYAR